MSEVNPLPLLKRCEAGEVGAIEEFILNYQPITYRLALSILDDPSEADEVAQDALVTALDRLASFRGEAAFTTWLYTLTLNFCRQRLRKRRSRARLASLLQAVLHAETRHLETEIQHWEADSALWNAIHRLTDNQREMIVLRFYYEFPIAKIAQVTGVSERTVHNRLKAALDRLRALLKEKDING
jgi:RNA polymerase sigma-70 factor (ECF subfamily)